MQPIRATRESALGGMAPAIALVSLAALVAISSVAFGPMAVLPIFAVVFFALVMTRPEYGIALFLSTFLMAYPRWLQGTGYLTLNNVLGGVFAVLLTYKVYREQDWWFVRCRELQLLALITVTFYLSERFNAPDPMKVSLLGAGFYFAEGLRLFVNRAAFTLFFVNYIRTPGHVRLIYLLALAFMMITALTGIQGVLRGGGLRGFRAFTEVEELVAGQAGLIRAAGNPNRLAMFAILAIAGLWYLMQSLRLPALRFLVIPTIVTLALAVFMTGSRSGLLGLGVCTVAIIADAGLDVRRTLSMVLAALLLLSVVGRFVPEKTLERITNIPGTEQAATGEGAGSLERRQYAWQIGLEMVRKSPILGVGMGNWAVARFIQDPGRVAASPHNSYLLAWAEGGIFCLLLFVTLLLRTWRNLRFAERYVSDREFPLADLAWVVKGARVSLLVLVFFSMFADLWNLVILFMLVGFGVVIRRMVEQTVSREALAY